MSIQNLVLCLRGLSAGKLKEVKNVFLDIQERTRSHLIGSMIRGRLTIGRLATKVCRSNELKALQSRSRI